VSKGGPKEEGGEGPALPRLPPGRHGLPREFVVKNQRDRLASGIISTVAERGYNETTITQIVEAAGVSRRTFYTYFSSKEECYVDTWELISNFITEVAAEAAQQESSWPAKVRARLEATLGTFASNPDLARFMLIAPTRAGNDIADRYRVGMVRALGDLTDGMPKKAQARRPSKAVELALVGGSITLISRKVEAGEGEDLSSLLPDLTELILAPYLGREEAARAANSAK
jgi:AcrR family transcriptional regulator